MHFRIYVYVSLFNNRAALHFYTMNLSRSKKARKGIFTTPGTPLSFIFMFNLQNIWKR